MKKIHKLILSTYIGPFVLTFFITLFILVMQFLWKYIDDLVGKGLDALVIGELLFYASANLVPMALPLAILLSSIMTFGNLGEHYELVALKTSGLSLQRIMRPLIVFTFVTAGVAFYFSNNIWPVANLKFATLLYDVRHKKPDIDIQPGIQYKGIDGYVILVGDKNKKTGELIDLRIYDHTERKGNTKVIHAKSGTMKTSADGRYLVLRMHDGASYEDLQQDPNRKPGEARTYTYPFFRTTFKEEIIRFDISGFALIRSNEEVFKDNTQMLRLDQIEREIDTLHIRLNERKAHFQDQMHRKLLYGNDSLNYNSTAKQWQSARRQAFTVDSVQDPGAPMDTATGRQVAQKIAKRNIVVKDTFDVVPAASVPADWTFIKDMPEKDQRKAVEGAINLARSQKTYIDSISREYDSRNRTIKKHWVEWHRKFTLSFACIVLFFIGAPLGSIIRKGGLGMPVVVSVLLFIVFHVLSITGEKMVKHGGLEPWQGMWMASLVLTPMGIYLTWKASTDSPVMDADTYAKLLAPIRWVQKAIWRKRSVPVGT